MKSNVNKMVKLAMLSALSVIFMVLIKFPLIPSAPFLIYEPGDIPALVAAFIFGPVSGFIVIVIVSLIQWLFFDTNGWVGAMMHIIASGSMVIVAGLIYKRMHNFKGAMFALLAGTITMTVVMIPLNLLVTPIFFGVPVKAVVAMLVPAIIPFNLLKAGINSVITAVVYKSVSKALKVEPLSVAKEIE
ncbi:MAG: ECF transporter S component [Bacillota bacterium]